MNSELFNCSVCYQEYNRTDRLPKMIPSCGHTLCSYCLNQILYTQQPPKCPLDRRVFPNSYNNSDLIPTNLLVLQLIDEKAKAEIKLCSVHKQPLNLVCLNDKSVICDACVKTGQHQGHKIKHINDMKNELRERKKLVEERVRESDGYQQAIYSLLGEEKKMWLMMIKERFEKMRAWLNKKEEDLWSGIGFFFSQEMMKTEEKLDQDLALRKIYQGVMMELGSVNTEEKSIKAFVDCVPKGQFVAKAEHGKLVDSMQRIKKNLLRTLDDLDRPLMAFNQDLQKVFSTAVTMTTPCSQPFQEQEQVIEEKPGNVLIPLETQKHKQILYKSTLNMKNQDGVIIISPNKNNQTTTQKEFTLSAQNKVHLILDQSSDDLLIQDIENLWPELDKISDLKLDLSNHKLTNESLNSLCLQPFWSKDAIQTFNLDLSNNKINDLAIIRIINETIMKMNNLKGLHLALANTKITNEAIEALADYVQSAVPFESFSLLINNTGISDNSIERLCVNLPAAVKETKTFTLGLHNTRITDRSIQAFTKQTLCTMSKLEALELNIYECIVTDSSLVPLFMEIRDLKTLSLGLSFTSITDRGLKALVIYGFPKLLNLESFRLELDETNVSDIGVADICSELGNIAQKLRIFTLDLANTNTSDVSIEAFTRQTLPKMADHLEKFELYLSYTEVTDKSIGALCTQMKDNMKNIKKFALSLGNNAITDVSIEALAKFTLPVMTLVEEFTLYCNYTQVTNQSFIILCESMKSILSHMKSLVFSFGGTKITDRGLKAFTKNILGGGLGYLEKVQLYFYSTQITDESVVKFCRSLKRVVSPKLKIFALRLFKTKITDKSVEELAHKVLPYMANVEEFELSLSKTFLTDNGIEKLCIGLKDSLKNVQKFCLKLAKTQITDKSLEFISQYILPNIPSIKNFKLVLDSTNITDQGLEGLFIHLRSALKSANEITLSLDNVNLTDKALQALSKHLLPSLVGLERLELCFSNNEVSDVGFGALCGAIRSPKAFYLDFHGTKIADLSVEALINLVLSTGTSLRDFNVNLNETLVSEVSMGLIGNLQEEMFVNVL